MKKSILILYTAVGKGHKTMAQNIAAYLGPEYDIDMLDLFEFQGGKLVEWGTKLYLWILDVVPGLWNFVYTNKTFLDLTIPFRTKLAGTKADKVLKKLQSKHYDIVLSTQVSPSSIMSYIKEEGLFNGKFVISFSDYHLHRYWLFKNADIFLVNIPEQKEEMVRLGYPAEKIYLVGMAMPEAKHFDKQEMKNKYGMSENDKGVLVIGGTMGYKLNPSLVKDLLKTNAKVFVVCGNNEVALKQMQNEFKGNNNVKVFGYVDFMQELYEVVDVVVSKPGGMTTAECLQRHLPLAVYSYLPGQEKINTEYLRAKNLVLPETSDIVKQVQGELSTGAFSNQLRTNKYVNVIVNEGSTVKQAIDSL